MVNQQNPKEVHIMRSPDFRLQILYLPSFISISNDNNSSAIIYASGDSVYEVQQKF